MRIRAPHLCVLVVLLTAPALVHAQFGGLLKKKAAEALKAKPTPPAPKPGPATVSTSEPTAPATASTSEPAASAPAAKSEPKAPTSPLDISDSDLTDKANQVMRELFPESGDWERLPYIRQSVVAAAKALDEPARLAFVEKVAGAFKTLVMSEKFAKAHAASIRQQHNAVDHGITGLVSTEELLKRKNFAAIEARTEAESAAVTVDNMESQDAESLQKLLAGELRGWTRRADDVKRKDRAKYQKMVRDAQALQALGTDELPKLRRGVAVLYSMDQDGPDTEQALYALRDRAKAESEQLEWDEYNLKAVLRKQLTAFVALVPTVDFAAATKDEEGMVRFVNPAHEKKGQVWKACFRAGKTISMSAMEMAQAWLKEL